jgi:DNA mismatch repair protein MutS2
MLRETMASFAPGDRVHVAALGTGVVGEVRNGGRCLVELKGRSIVVDAASLEPARERRTQKPQVVDTGGASDGRARLSASIDLHGKTAAEAIDALDAFLNDALIAGASEARVIHGRSGGRVKAAVHARLRQLPALGGFRLDPRNPGVTIVKL